MPGREVAVLRITTPAARARGLRMRARFGLARAPCITTEEAAHASVRSQPGVVRAGIANGRELHFTERAALASAVCVSVLWSAPLPPNKATTTLFCSRSALSGQPTTTHHCRTVSLTSVKPSP